VRSQRLALLVGLFSLAVLSGCTVQSQGSPRPTPASIDSPASESPPSSSEEASTGTSLPNYGAPNVEDPLEITEFVREPCRALTAEQTTELNLPTTGTAGTNALGQVCEWENSETRGRVTIDIREKNAAGLSALYAANDNGEYGFFEELAPIEGYPAVAYDISDKRPSGMCAVSVGVANDLSFAVGLRLSPNNVGAKDPCETAASVADMMMKTMKETS
jgi:hypothetical protein